MTGRTKLLDCPSMCLLEDTLNYFWVIGQDTSPSSAEPRFLAGHSRTFWGGVGCVFSQDAADSEMTLCNTALSSFTTIRSMQ